jgi:tetratricopeptide (TPR) repeat protein
MPCIISILFVLVALMLRPAPAAGQSDPIPDMNAIARALGVSCNYCHASENGSTDFKSDANPKKALAREMLAMTRDLNARIQAATGKSAIDVTTIQCVNCHRGVPIPKKLSDILIRTILDKGADAAVEQYRDLRARFYARDTYDFSEDELLALCQRLAEARPSAALPLLQMNLEFNPKSARTYVVMSRAYVLLRDHMKAVETLKKALEIDPDNTAAKGYLYQLEPQPR